MAVDPALIVGAIGAILGLFNTLWIFINVWMTRHLVKRLNLDISCEQKKVGQEKYLIMTASVANVGGTRVEPKVAELTLDSESVEFFNEAKSTWERKLIIDCHEFLGEVVDPEEIVHRGYAVKTKGIGVVDIIFEVTSPPTFAHPKSWLWRYVKCGCVQ